MGLKSDCMWWQVMPEIQTTITVSVTYYCYRALAFRLVSRSTAWRRRLRLLRLHRFDSVESPNLCCMRDYRTDCSPFPYISLPPFPPPPQTTIPPLELRKRQFRFCYPRDYRRKQHTTPMIPADVIPVENPC